MPATKATTAAKPSRPLRQRDSNRRGPTQQTRSPVAPAHPSPDVIVLSSDTEDDDVPPVRNAAKRKKKNTETRASATEQQRRAPSNVTRESIDLDVDNWPSEAQPLQAESSSDAKLKAENRRLRKVRRVLFNRRVTLIRASPVARSYLVLRP